MRTKNWMLGGILATIAILGPMVAYAGVSVIYPSSSHTATTVATAPISFAEGADYTLAETLGFATDFATADSASHFSVSLNGIGGGTIIIDKYATITRTSGVSSYKMSIATAMTGTMDATEIASLKVRLWTGATPPVLDGSTGVCAVLDLEAIIDTESTNACSDASVFMQVTYQLSVGATGSSSVAIRPSTVVFA